jgi:glycosyltransferase involved in cell wall biosynthesis
MGLVIGDGSGLARLKERCIALGVEDRVVFVGRIPYRQLPRFINLMDICLSTQTNDTAGQVRTTGKLPIYLACGRFVLASQVGEAARVLPAEMLVPYTGAKDIDYPGRLTARIASLLDYPERLQQGAAGVAIAKALFDYDVLAASVRTTIRRLLSVPGSHDALVPADDSNPANVNPGAGIQRN